MNLELLALLIGTVGTVIGAVASVISVGIALRAAAKARELDEIE